MPSLPWSSWAIAPSRSLRHWVTALRSLLRVAWSMVSFSVVTVLERSGADRVHLCPGLGVGGFRSVLVVDRHLIHTGIGVDLALQLADLVDRPLRHQVEPLPALGQDIL